MKSVVADAMKDGALGLSTSLQYVPARFAKTDEIVELAKVARQYGGIYITHQRSEANAIDESMHEVFEIARRANIPTEIWHFKTAYKKNWGRMPEMLRRIAAARRQGLEDHRRCLSVHCRQHFAERVSATVGAGRRNRSNVDALEGHAHPAATEERNLQLTRKTGRIFISAAAAPSGILIASVTNRELEKWQGKRLSEVAAAAEQRSAGRAS